MDRHYVVLATVSRGYPPAEGRLPTRYSPVRHFPPPEGGFSFDLHVLSPPPAFVLSQDQTLRSREIDLLKESEDSESGIELRYPLGHRLLLSLFGWSTEVLRVDLFSSVRFRLANQRRAADEGSLCFQSLKERRRRRGWSRPALLPERPAKLRSPQSGVKCFVVSSLSIGTPGDCRKAKPSPRGVNREGTHGTE